MNDLQRRNYALKVALVAILVACFGIGFLVLAKFAEIEPSLLWLRWFPVDELGSTLFISGAFVVIWEYFDGRDRERRDDARIRRLLKESAPEFRDAVVRGFAVQPDDLKRVASPRLLDGIATNVLSLRLGDAQFAREIYEDVRDQAIRAPERWHDVQVHVRLSTAVERGANSTPLFDVLVEWEYTTTPSHSLRRIACVSSRDEYFELVTETPATSTWFMPASSGCPANARSSFELLEFTVDGEPRPIRRSARKTGQTYTVNIDNELTRPVKAVRIRQVYRTRVAQKSNALSFELPAPSRGVSFEFDYTGANVTALNVVDTVPGVARPRIARLPEQLPGKAVSIEVPGWLLPRAGFTFVWTLSAEQSPAPRLRAPKIA